MTPAAKPAAAPAAAASAQPAPAKGGSNVLKIVLLVLGGLFLLGVVATGVVTYIGYRFAKSVVVEEDGGTRIQTPMGTIEAHQDSARAAEDLGIKIYPGATSAEGGGSVNFGGVKATTAIFESDDSPDKVAEFYRKEFPKAHISGTQGDTHTIMSQIPDGMITVLIEAQGEGSRITLSRTSK